MCVIFDIKELFINIILPSGVIFLPHLIVIILLISFNLVSMF